MCSPLSESPLCSDQVIYTHVPLSPGSIIWYWPNGWEVNRQTTRCTRSGSIVSQCIHLRATETDISTAQMGHYLLFFTNVELAVECLGYSKLMLCCRRACCDSVVGRCLHRACGLA